jgi:hypothetical protein
MPTIAIELSDLTALIDAYASGDALKQGYAVAKLTKYITPPAPPRTITTKLDGKTAKELRNAVVDVSGKEGVAAIVVTGADCVISNVEQIGNGMLLQMNGAKNLLADGIKSINGKLIDKGIYSGGALNENITIRNFEIFCRAPVDANDNVAEHGIRFHGWKNITLENGSVDYRNYKYKGAALTVHEPGENLTVHNVRFCGPVGVENLPVNNTKPEGVSWRTKNVTFEGCEINTPNFFRCGAGAENVTVRDSTIRAVKWPSGPDQIYNLTPSGTCLDLGGPLGPWPSASGVFERVKFEGTALMSAASAVNVVNFKFVACTYNGRPLSESGKVL